MRDPTSSADIPPTQERDERQRAEILRATKISLRLIPDVPHRGKAVAHMRHTLRNTHILGGGVTERDDEIVSVEIKRARREWVQREESFIELLYSGNLREE
jgi:hypothetical protein